MQCRCSNLSYEQKFKIYGLKLALKKSFREMEKILDISKSTIHYNFAAIVDELDSIEKNTWDETELLVYFVLNGVFEGKMSVRSVEAMILVLFKKEVSHQTLLVILQYAAEIAAELNQEIGLEHIQCAIFDEIFQGSDPILSMADPISGLVCLKAAMDRSGDEWEVFLMELKERGLDPESVNTDGGTGLLKGLLSVFENAVQMRDFFHILQKLSKAKRAMEGICYSLIHATGKKSAHADETRSKCNEAIDIFDLYEKSFKALQKSCYLSHEDGVGHYTSSEGLREILMSCHSVLDNFIVKIRDHKAIHDGRSYLKNGAQTIVAYKKLIEAKVTEVFGATGSDIVLRGIMPLVECMMQYQRSYESRSRMNLWGKKVAEIRAQLRSYSFVNQEEVDAAIGNAWQIINSTVKSNSLIESVNSVIRSHLDTFKSIPSWFCQIFTFYWNNRVFSRGKRAGNSPIGLYRPDQKPSQSWILQIMSRFPFEKIRSGISAKLPLLAG